MRSHSDTNNLIKYMVIFCDFALMNITLWIFIHSSFDFVPLSFSMRVRITMLLANFGMVVSQSFFSTVAHKRRIRTEQILSQSSKLVLFFLMLFVMFTEFAYYQDSPIRFFVYFGVVLFALIISQRYILRSILKTYRKRGRNTRKVVFVGNDEVLKTIYGKMTDDPAKGLVCKGYYADTPMEDCPEGLTYKGTLDDIMMKTTRERSLQTSDEMYCCLPYEKAKDIKRLMKFCDKNVIHFFFVPVTEQSLQLKLKMEQFDDINIFTSLEEPLSYMGNRALKRAFDLVFALGVLIVTLPFYPIIALIIKLQSPGPIFFRQKRTGANGTEFNCLKFRSMHVNVDADTKQATENDPRKFPFGNFMREKNIDELPQFINVLTGSMSVVGPRPHMIYHTEMYSKLIDQYMVRHFAKPGITGWAQVTGFRGETKELWQMEERVKRDIWYIENWSLWLDIRIIWMTIRNTAGKEEGNAY